MKRKMNIISQIISFLVLTFALSFLVGCDKNEKPANGENTSEEYQYEYNKPFSDKPDDFMNIDGEFTETEWQNQQWLTYKVSGACYEITTLYTQKGMYIGGKAEDNYVYWHGQFNYDANSSFEIQVIRPDEQEVDHLNSWLYRPGRVFQFQIDVKDTRSYKNTPFLIQTKVDGEYNTATSKERIQTKGWSFELYVSWEAMRLEEKYFAEDGIPNEMKLFASYLKIDGENENKINDRIIPTNTERHRYDSYWIFDRGGLSGDYTCKYLNNAIDGPAATDRWIYGIDDDGKEYAETKVNRTQITWAQGKRSTNYMVEATFKISEITDIPKMQDTSVGFIVFANTHMNDDGLSIYAVYGRDLLKKNELKLISSSITDGYQWLGNRRFNDTVKKNYTSKYGKDSVHLKLIKMGGYLYYFYNDVFFGVEYLSGVKGETNIGVYANGATKVTDFKYEDYDTRIDELTEEVSKYVYFIDLPDNTKGGKVLTNSSVVAKGTEVKLHIYPNSGYLISDLKMQEGDKAVESVYEDIQGTEYTFTPTANTTFTADFHKLDQSKETTKVIIEVHDGDTGNSVPGSTYEIYDQEKRVFYSGSDNGRGAIILSVPKQITIATASGDKAFSGNYTIEINHTGYIKAITNFSTGEQSELDVMMVSLYPSEYKKVYVNGTTTSDAEGNFDYDLDEKSYFHAATTDSGVSRLYNGNYIGKEYVVDVEIQSEKATGVPNVPGIAISIGDGKTVMLKLSPWDPNRIFIHCGRTPKYQDSEISVDGFMHGQSASGGVSKFRVVSKNNNIFIFNSEGDLGVVFNNNGINLVGNHQLVTKTNYEYTNNNVAAMFYLKDKNQAVGILNYYNPGSAKTFFKLNYHNDEAAINAALSGVKRMDFALTESDEYQTTIDAIRIGNQVVEQTNILVSVKMKDTTKVAKVLKIAYEGGKTEDILGRYDAVRQSTVFSFIPSGKCLNSQVVVDNLYIVSGKVTTQNEIVSTVNVVFIDTETGQEYKTTADEKGNYELELFSGTYNVACTGISEAAMEMGVVVDQSMTKNFALEKHLYMVGNAVVNGKTISSSAGCATLDVQNDSIDGTVTIPANNSSMMTVFNNQVYKGSDNFVYTIEMDMKDVPISTGTNYWDTQIGFGLTDGDYWWIFYIKNGFNDGKSFSIGLHYSGYGGSDFQYNTTESPNSIVSDSIAKTITIKATLTIEKNGDMLILYAGSGEEKIQLFSATKTKYDYYVSGSISNQSVADGHLGKLDKFFDPNREFALCLASMFYNASITFKTTIEKYEEPISTETVSLQLPSGIKVKTISGTELEANKVPKNSRVVLELDTPVSLDNLGVYGDGELLFTMTNGEKTSASLRFNKDTAITLVTLPLSSLNNANFVVNGNVIDKAGTPTSMVQTLWSGLTDKEFVYTLEINRFDQDWMLVGGFIEAWLRVGLEKQGGVDQYAVLVQGPPVTDKEFALHGVDNSLKRYENTKIILPDSINTASKLFVGGKATMQIIVKNGYLFLTINGVKVNETGLIASTDNKDIMPGLLAHNVGECQSIFTKWSYDTSAAAIQKAMTDAGIVANVTFDNDITVKVGNQTITSGASLVPGTKVTITKALAANQQVSFKANDSNIATNNSGNIATAELVVFKNTAITYGATILATVTTSGDFNVVNEEGVAVDLAKAYVGMKVKFTTNSAVLDNDLGIFADANQVATIYNGTTVSNVYEITGDCTITANTVKMTRITDRWGDHDYEISANGKAINKVSTRTSDQCEGTWTDLGKQDNFVYQLVINESAYNKSVNGGIGAFFDDWLRITLYREASGVYSLSLQGGGTVSGDKVSGGLQFYTLPETMNSDAEIMKDGKVELTFVLAANKLSVFINGTNTGVSISTTSGLVVGLFAREIAVCNNMYANWSYVRGQAEAYLEAHK